MIPGLGMPSPVRRGRLPWPRRRPRRRRERRWGCDASASPGTVSVGRRGRSRPHRGVGRRRSGAIANLELGDVATRGPGVGHTLSKTSSFQPAPLNGQARLGRRVYSHWNLSWFRIQNCVICHLTSQVGWLWYCGQCYGQNHGQYHCWYHRPVISEVTDIIVAELWYYSFNSMISYMIWRMKLFMIWYRSYWYHTFRTMIS
jgi:hypothetical protein